MQDSQNTVLGVEGGGTKTDWMLIGADGATLRSGQLPAANLKLISDEQLAQIFAVLPDAASVGVFLAGCLTAGDHDRLRRLAVARWPASKLALGNDRDSGFATALGDGDGIIVISGTGAVVQGRSGARMEKAGGWGHILGDRGGGYDVARHALRKILLRYDLEGALSPLASSVLTALGLNELPQLVDWIHNTDKMSVARLAPVIFRAAENGDHDMLALIKHRARDLAEFTYAVAKRLGLSERPIPVRLLGGLLTKEPFYAATYSEFLATMLPLADVDICSTSGAAGAAALAGAVAKPEPQKVQRVSEIEHRELALATTEQLHPRSLTMEAMSPSELVALFIEEEDCVRQALLQRAPELTVAVEKITETLKAGGRLFYVGAGTSGRLGVLDASEIPPTFGSSPELVQGIIAGGAPALTRAAETAEDSPEAGALAIVGRGVRRSDIVCGITASGRTPFVLGALAKARDLGARTLLLTCNPARNRTAVWDVEIDLPTGAELVAGSTRLKAGTATKVALNLLTTATMILLGKVKAGAMVDMKASNAKLRDRAVRTVQTVLGISEDAARTLLESRGWSIREAVEK
jgi:N-acetylmuramic acid 6-phosphate etherase